MTLAYPLRIELRDFKPAIYRDVLVDPATPLLELHKLIQAAMGWEDVHLHGFAKPVKNERFWRAPSIRRFEKRTVQSFGEAANNETRFLHVASPADRCVLHRTPQTGQITC
jgi:Plasmid pRiA4b ORF-3-like protein